MKNSITIHRTRIGKDIVAEFAIPPSKKHQKEGRVAILCQGAPTMPGNRTVVEFLSRKGFYVLLPRYRGSWESGGKFLEKEPTKDIQEVVDSLSKPFVSLYEKKSYQFPRKAKIYLFVGSFGGPAGFLLSRDMRVRKVIAMSPVCDWTDDCGVEPLDELDYMTKLIYGEGYRLSKNAWKKLKKGNFYNPMTTLKLIDGKKIYIFHAKTDDVVNIKTVKRFAEVTGAELLITKSGGHMGLSELMNPDTWKEIEKFLKK